MKTTLNYKKNDNGKTVLDIEEKSESLDGMHRAYNRILAKLRNEITFDTIIEEMTEDDLIFFFLKNYIRMLNNISNTNKPDKYFDYTDKMIFYYIKTIKTNKEISDFAVFDSTLDDVDQFIQIMDINKNRQMLEGLAYMYFDMMLEEQQILNEKAQNESI